MKWVVILPCIIAAYFFAACIVAFEAITNPLGRLPNKKAPTPGE